MGTGTQELTAILDLVLTLVGIAKDVEADGKIDITDLAFVMRAIPKIDPAFKNMSQAPVELKDLDAKEAAELVSYTAANLVVKDEHAKAIVTQGLKVLQEMYSLYKAVHG